MPNPEIEHLIDRALAEDVGAGDLTTAAVVEPGVRARARIDQKAPGMVFGLDVAEAVFRRLDPEVTIERRRREGDWLEEPPAVVLGFEGDARAMLTAERTALNFLAHLSGVATATARAVRALRRDARAGPRHAQDHAGPAGAREGRRCAPAAGRNHRIGLYDAILVKENHIALAGGVGEATRRALAGRPPGVAVEVDVPTLAEVDEALAAGADAPAARQHDAGAAARGGGAVAAGARSWRPPAASRLDDRPGAGEHRDYNACRWGADALGAGPRPLADARDARREAASPRFRQALPTPRLEIADIRGAAERGARARRGAQRRDPGPQLPGARGPGRGATSWATRSASRARRPTPDADVIAFCGVHFMAETASILSPDKTVLLPDLDAGCSLADSITADQLRAWKAEHPGAIVVMYVNTTAEVKAETDYCCTSSNAVQVVEHICREHGEDTEILFGPDMWLGAYVERDDRAATCTSGTASATCTPASGRRDITDVRASHPDAEFLIHPECGCTTQVMEYVASGDVDCRSARTCSPPAGMLSFARRLRRRHVHRRDRDRDAAPAGARRTPARRSSPANRAAVCRYMKMITLPKLRDALRDLKPVVTVPTRRRRARARADRAHGRDRLEALQLLSICGCRAAASESSQRQRAPSSMPVRPSAR